MGDTVKRSKKNAKKSKSADKKPNTQAIRRSKYNSILNQMQAGSQCYDILALLIRKGSTTSREIESELDIVSPTARMSELRNKWGLPITKTTIKKNNKKGKLVTYGKFTLEV